MQSNFQTDCSQIQYILEILGVIFYTNTTYLKKYDLIIRNNPLKHSKPKTISSHTNICLNLINIKYVIDTLIENCIARFSNFLKVLSFLDVNDHYLNLFKFKNIFKLCINLKTQINFCYQSNFYRELF